MDQGEGKKGCPPFLLRGRKIHTDQPPKRTSEKAEVRGKKVVLHGKKIFKPRQKGGKGDVSLRASQGHFR